MTRFKRARALLIKEIRLLLKRPAVLFLLIFVPIFFGLVFASYESAIPKDTPVAIVLKGNVSQDEVREILSIARTFSSPTLVPGMKEAIDGLQREDYYVIIEIQNYTDLAHGSYTVYYDDSMTPVASISENLLEILQIRFGGAKIRSVPLNRHASLPEFFFPGVLLIMAMIIGMEVVPDNTIEDAPVLPRLKMISSIWTNFSVRFLMAIGLAFFQALLAFLSYRLTPNSPNFTLAALFVLFITTLYLALLGLAFVLAFRFERYSKGYLQVTAGFLVFMSGMLYPVGFFPKSLQYLAHLLPTYYSAVMMRAFMYRSVHPSLFSDYLAVITLWTTGLFLLDLLLAGRLKEWAP